MKSVLYLVSKKASLTANETVDMMLVSGVFEQPCSVVFIDDGVYQLFGDMMLVRTKDTSRALSALPTYGIDRLYADNQSLYERNLQFASCHLSFQTIDVSEITQLFNEHDIVVTD